MTGHRVAVPWALLLCAAVAAACTRASLHPETRYHCPMHPTYVSDRPGDCPICGMRLVPTSDAKVPESPPDPAPAPSSAPGRYVCPMTECGTVSDHPGRCPKCGMDLVPASEADPAQAPGEAPPQVPDGPPPGMAEITASRDGLRLLGVRTVTASLGRLDRTVRAVGHVAVDETRIHRVHARVSGYIERLYVNQTGQPVRKGAPLLEIYSPELLASQEELLRAMDAARRLRDSSLPEVRQGVQDLVEASRQRLELFGVPSSFVREVTRTGRPRRTVTLRAPASGVVTAKGVFEGQHIDPDTEVMTISDLSRVWIEGELYENEALGLSVGQRATASLSYAPGTRLEARVTFIGPTLDPVTRTVRFRLEADPADGRWRPGDLANIDIALESVEGILVPDTAVLDTGDREVVFVAAKEDHFVPRTVTVALRHGGQALVSEGLAAGEPVAVTATFLLDSESRIRSAIRETSANPLQEDHQGHDR